MLPVLYPFGSKDRWLEVAPAFFGDTDREVLNELLDKNLLPVLQGPEIAIYLGISPKLLSHMVKRPLRCYSRFEIRKKNGHLRPITAPRVFLKTVQRYILDCILSQLTPNDAACGFRRGFNCAEGARRHIGRPYLWNIDLADFFPSITKAQVRQLFRDIGYPDTAAFFLSGLCCLEGRLPQGAPTSPAIANLVSLPLDVKLANVANSASIVYSRYADDLSFSSNTLISPDFQAEVLDVVHAFGFRIQPSKTRLMGPAIRREVTGLTVNQKVSIPRHRRRQLRAYFHHIRLNPDQYAEEKQRAMGFARWLYDFHPVEGARAIEIVSLIPIPGPSV